MRNNLPAHKGSPIEVARQIAFFAPADGKGKWHAAWKVSHVPVCGNAAELVRDEAIRTQVGQTYVHPIVCRRCLRLTVVPGRNGSGFVQ